MKLFALILTLAFAQSIQAAAYCNDPTIIEDWKTQQRNIVTPTTGSSCTPFGWGYVKKSGTAASARGGLQASSKKNGSGSSGRKKDG